MTTPSTNWSRWPHPITVSDPLLDTDVEKRAEQQYGRSLEDVLRGVADCVHEVENELPQGIAKFAAARFGTNDPLPEVTHKNIWRHPNAHPLVLMMLLLDRFGQDSLDWEPEALRLTLRKNDIQLSESVWQKILAARVILESPVPWRQWEQFHWVSMGLGGKTPSFVYLERPELGFIMSAVDQMKMIDKARPFAEDIDKFTAAVLRDMGVMYAPPPVQFAQEELDDRHIKCRHCGTHEKDDHDIKCIACGSKDLEHIAGEHEELAKKTKSMFEARKKFPLEHAVAGLGNSAADIATYRLLTHNEYRNQIRAQLLEQLRMLRRGP